MPRAGECGLQHGAARPLIAYTYSEKWGLERTVGLHVAPAYT